MLHVGTVLAMKKKKNKIKHPDYRDLGPVPTPVDWEARHHAAALEAREHPGSWFAIYSTKAETAYATLSNWRSGRRRSRAYGPGFEFRTARIEDEPDRRELCVRYVEPKKKDLESAIDH